MTQFTISVTVEQRPLARPFVIARGTITEVEFVTVSMTANGAMGRGESCPVPHFGETVEGVVAAAREWAVLLEGGEDWPALHDRCAPGAARNAIDCAWWDWRAKSEGRPAWALLGLPEPELTTTAFTIGIDTPGVMGDRAAIAAKAHKLLKVKLGAADDLARIRAVRAAAPYATLIADANEGWSPAELAAAMPVLVECGYAMLEQPFRAGNDRLLDGIERHLPIAADESCHVAADVSALAPFYDMVNVKLDKSGGMTEAIRLLDAAQAAGLDAMVGCMLGTSLAMAPALLLAGRCRFADLDAPLLMGSDREPALTYRDGTVAPPFPALWG